MLDFIISETNRWTAGFSYAFPRMLTVFLVLPFFTREMIGDMARGGVAAALTVIMIPVVTAQSEIGEFDFTKFMFMLPKEILIGLIIGYLLSIPFQIGSLTGKIIDMQRGDSISSTFDPMLKANDSSLGRLINQGQYALFFSSGAFLLAMQGIYDSYIIWPVHQFLPELQLVSATKVGEIFQYMFYAGIVLSSPLVILMLVVDLVMGFIGRFVSNLQVFIVAFPVKGIVAAIVVVIYFSVIMTMLEQELDRYTDFTDVLGKILRGII